MADLRIWLADVDQIGQLMSVDGVNWDLELSTLTEIINERSKNRPALLFDGIKDYAMGLSSRRRSRVVGLIAWH